LSIYNRSISAQEVAYLYESKKAQFIEYVSGYQEKGDGLKLNNSYISVPDNASLRPGVGSFSVSLWFNAPNVNQVSPLIVKRQNGSPYEMYGLTIGGPNSHSSTLGKRLNFNYIQVSGSVEKSGYTNRDIADGEWHHAVMVIDDVLQKVIIYVDGEEESLTLDFNYAWPNLIDNPDNLYIGGNPDTGYYSNILVDEVQIYNRALSSQEILDLYNERHGRLDYSDVRFYNSTGNGLNYYHEFDNKFWVKVPSIPAGESNITMYYGNSEAVSQSNGETTFDFFDDFSTTILDTINGLYITQPKSWFI